MKKSGIGGLTHPPRRMRFQEFILTLADLKGLGQPSEAGLFHFTGFPANRGGKAARGQTDSFHTDSLSPWWPASAAKAVPRIATLWDGSKPCPYTTEALLNVTEGMEPKGNIIAERTASPVISDFQFLISTFGFFVQ